MVTSVDGRRGDAVGDLAQESGQFALLARGERGDRDTFVLIELWEQRFDQVLA